MPNSFRSLPRVAQACVLHLLISTVSAAAADPPIVTTRLSEAANPTGETRQVALSPDGAWTLYLVNQKALDRFALYSYPTAGGSPVRLHPPLPPGSSVAKFTVTPDSTRVVFAADLQQPGAVELWSVPIGGGTPTPLSGPMPEGGDVEKWILDPTGARVVYAADQSQDETYQLFSVPVGGGSPTLLADLPVAFTGDIPELLLATEDGSRVVFVASGPNDGSLNELWSVPTTGGSPTRLDPLGVGDAIQYPVVLSPDGTRVAFVVRFESRSQLLSVPVGGGNFARLTPDEPYIGGPSRVLISPDSATVVYVSDHDVTGIHKLWSVPLTGGTPVRLNGPLVQNGDVSRLQGGLAIDDGTQTVLYLADQQIDEVWELFRVPIAGGTARKVHETLTAGESVNFILPLAGSPTVYLRVTKNGTISQLYSAPIDGIGAPLTRIHPELPPGATSVYGAVVSESSGRVVYGVDFADPELRTLYSSPLTEDTSVALSAAPAANGFVSNFEVAPDGGTVLYRSRQDSAAQLDLYRVPVTGGPNTRVNDPIEAVTAWISDDFLVHVPSRRVVTPAEIDGSGRRLYSFSVGGGPAVPLSDPDPTSFLSIRDVLLSSDGLRVLYTMATDSAPGLFSVPADGGEAVRLDPGKDEQLWRQVGSTPDDATAFFRFTDDSGSSERIYRAPISGGASTDITPSGLSAFSTMIPDASSSFLLFTALPDDDAARRVYRLSLADGEAVELSGPLLADHGVDLFQLTPDGLQVVYLTSEIGTSDCVLYSVPVAGGQATQLTDLELLSPQFDYVLSSDSQRVLFEARHVPSGTQDLYSVAVGGTVPVRLSPESANPGRNFRNFKISPDSGRVVYLSDQDTEGAGELYGVPIAGGPTVKLNPPIQTESPQTISFQFSPDSSRVVFNAEIEGETRPRLFSVPAAGGAVVAVSPDEPGSVLPDFRVGSNDFVFYRRSANLLPGAIELFRVPISGGEAVRAHPEAVATQSFANLPQIEPDFFLSTDGSLAVFVGDVTVRGMDELWAAEMSWFFDDFEAGDTSGWSQTVP